MKKHVSLDVYRAEEHAQVTMRKLGVTYDLAVPQSMGDCWWFFNCVGLPEPLPDGIKELTGTPHEYIGFGLSRLEADAIADNSH